MSSGQRRPERPLGRVAILGLGLMGGSLARGISGLELAARVTGWSPLSTERDAALTAGAVTLAAADWRDAVADADLVVLAVPLGAAADFLSELGGAAPSTATLTDVTSLKAPLSRAAAAAGLAERWVGAHPMAGGEATGFWASRADLYQGARVWTVPGEAAEEHRVRVDRLWRGLGADPRPLGADQHDRLMELVSHLPQLVSNVLASVLDDAGVEPGQLGPGGRDMTRLAASDPVMWLDLLEHASPALAAALREGAQELDRAASLLEAGDLDALGRLMRSTRSWKDGA